MLYMIVGGIINIFFYNNIFRQYILDNFFANNVNLQDDIDMMEKIPEYNSIIHADLSNTPISDIKDEGMKLTNKLIDYIKDSRKYLG